MVHKTIPASISLARVGTGRCLSLVLAFVLAGCTTENLRESDSGSIRSHADTAYQEGDWQGARQDYEYLTRNGGGGALEWYRLGNVYAHLNRPDDAIAAYREALKYDQGNSEVWNNLGLVQLRQAMQTFIDMVDHTDANDPLNIRARYAVSAITELLEARFGTPDAQ